MARPLDGVYFEVDGDMLSDLFFNARHPEYDAAKENGGDFDALNEAIMDDATAYANILGIGSALVDGIHVVMSGSRLADALAEDFLIRAGHIKA